MIFLCTPLNFLRSTTLLGITTLLEVTILSEVTTLSDSTNFLEVITLEIYFSSSPVTSISLLVNTLNMLICFRGFSDYLQLNLISTEVADWEVLLTQPSSFNGKDVCIGGICIRFFSVKIDYIGSTYIRCIFVRDTYTSKIYLFWGYLY